MAVDWATIASLATAGGTLVLAVSTFASLRSANRAARAAERSFLVGLQPQRGKRHRGDAGLAGMAGKADHGAAAGVVGVPAAHPRSVCRSRGRRFLAGGVPSSGRPGAAAVADAVKARRPVTVDVLYGDYEGGQRLISRFTLLSRGDSGPWIVSVSHHWNLDRLDPR
jgi:hypothetical protein